MKVAITGLASTLARVVVPELLASGHVDAVRGFDLRHPTYPLGPRVTFTRGDVRDEQALARLVEGVDAVIHMAFVVTATHLPVREVYDINVNGSRRVFHTALAAGVPKLVYTSSVAAYGATAAAPPWIPETFPLLGRRNLRFVYARTKALAEAALAREARARPEVTWTVLRPHIIAGPVFGGVTSNLGFLTRQFATRGRTVWQVRPLNEPCYHVQLTHERDLARVILHALTHDFPGAYNVAGAPVNLSTYARDHGKRVRYIPWHAAVGFTRFLRLFSRKIHWLEAWLQGIQYRLVVSTRKLARSSFPGALQPTRAILDDLIRARQ